MEALNSANNQTVNYSDFLGQLKAFSADLKKQQKLENTEEIDKETNQNQVSKTLSIGTYPGAGNLMSENTKQNQKGFTGPWMLGFLSFLFETLFLLISFLIFQ